MSPMLIASIVPAAVDLIKNGMGALTTRFIGLSVDDQIKLDNAAIEKLKALAALDNPVGNPSQWVVDLRAAFRYVSAGVLIVAGIGIALYGLGIADPLQQTAVIAFGLDTAGAPFAFIFGERMWAGFKNYKK